MASSLLPVSLSLARLWLCFADSGPWMLSFSSCGSTASSGLLIWGPTASHLDCLRLLCLGRLVLEIAMQPSCSVFAAINPWSASTEASASALQPSASAMQLLCRLLAVALFGLSSP
ncbi:hypothetical protein U1Q18_000074, partial [Sarracenia purpurea var. burkii]